MICGNESVSSHVIDLNKLFLTPFHPNLLHFISIYQCHVIPRDSFSRWYYHSLLSVIFICFKSRFRTECNYNPRCYLLARNASLNVKTLPHDLVTIKILVHPYVKFHFMTSRCWRATSKHEHLWIHTYATFCQVLSGDLSPLLFNGTWVSGRHICYRDASGGISLMDSSDPNITSHSLMPNSTFVSIYARLLFSISRA